MSDATRSPLVSELGTERRIVICAALALILLSLVFRNDRALLLGPGAPADRDASAFTAIVAPPAAGGASISTFAGVASNTRRAGTRAPAGSVNGTPAFTPSFVAPAPTPGAAAGATEGPSAPGLPVELAGNGPARSYTPQMASFIGLPGGVIFGSGGTTTPTNPTDPTTPTNPTNPTNPTDPTNPTNPTNPTDPTNPTNPTDPTGPTTPPDPGPGAVPEPMSWALMILGIGMVGASLRRRRAAEPVRAGLSAAA